MATKDRHIGHVPSEAMTCHFRPYLNVKAASCSNLGICGISFVSGGLQPSLSLTDSTDGVSPQQKEQCRSCSNCSGIRYCHPKGSLHQNVWNLCFLQLLKQYDLSWYDIMQPTTYEFKLTFSSLSCFGWLLNGLENRLIDRLTIFLEVSSTRPMTQESATFEDREWIWMRPSLRTRWKLGEFTTTAGEMPDTNQFFQLKSWMFLSLKFHPLKGAQNSSYGCSSRKKRPFWPFWPIGLVKSGKGNTRNQQVIRFANSFASTMKLPQTPQTPATNKCESPVMWQKTEAKNPSQKSSSWVFGPDISKLHPRDIFTGILGG